MQFFAIDKKLQVYSASGSDFYHILMIFYLMDKQRTWLH